MEPYERMLLGLALYILLLIGLNINCHASVSVKEATAIYKMLIYKNKLDAPPLYVFTNRYPNAYTSKHCIYITTGALKLENKAEIACTLGHELTHYKFNDPYKWFIIGKHCEDRADLYGAYYARNIGYSYHAQSRLYKLYYHLSGDQGNHNDHHSANSLRYWRLNHAR